jgi:hypothetical protein
VKKNSSALSEDLQVAADRFHSKVSEATALILGITERRITEILFDNVLQSN